MNKHCAACGIEKSISEFSPRRSSRDGLEYSCKPCMQERRRTWYQTNLDRAREQKRLNRQKHYAKRQAQEQRYKEANREKYRAQSRKWHAEHKDESRAYNQKRYLEKREQILAGNRAYKKRDPIANRARVARRKTHMRSNGGTFTTAEWQELCDLFGNACLACLANDELTIDHIVPVSKGGNNTIHNLQPLCFPCNLEKRDTTVDYRSAWITLLILSQISST